MKIVDMLSTGVGRGQLCCPLVVGLVWLGVLGDSLRPAWGFVALW